MFWREGDKDTKGTKERKKGGKGRKYEINNFQLNFDMHFTLVLYNYLRADAEVQWQTILLRISEIPTSNLGVRLC
jgi:hypothetical protein